MMRRFRLLPLLALVACDGEPDCKDAYEDYITHLRTRYESCGLEFGAEPNGPGSCEGNREEAFLCLDDCVGFLSCGAIDGTDPTAAQAYTDCITACPLP